MKSNKNAIFTIEQQLESYDKKLSVKQKSDKMLLLTQLYEEEGEFKKVKQIGWKLIKLINANIINEEYQVQAHLKNILEKIYIRMGRYDFHCYMIAMEWNRRIESRFYHPRMKILRPVVQDLQDLTDGVIDFYMLNMPPRVGKSTLGLFYLSFIAGRNPNGNSLGVSYTTGIVKTFHVGILDFMTNSEYNFKKIFNEDYQIQKNSEYYTINLNTTGGEDRYTTIALRSIDGTITGATEAKDLLYLDDLCSGIQEAMNRDRLDTAWQKVSVDLQQRRVNDPRTNRTAPILAIGTIWSINDALCKLRMLNEDNPKARIRTIPALDDNDESNFTYSYGVGFSTEYYHELRNGMDTVSFNCVYQQEPMEREGLLFPKEELNYFFELPLGQPDEIYMANDCAFGGSDFYSAPIALQYGNDVYINDVVFLKGSYEKTQPIVYSAIVNNKVQRIHFEGNNGGDFYSRDIHKMLKDIGYSCNLTCKNQLTNTAKLSRIIQHSPAIKSFYFKHPSLWVRRSMYWSFMKNLTTFLQTGNSVNDDAPDSLAMIAVMKRFDNKGHINVHNRQGI